MMQRKSLKIFLFALLLLVVGGIGFLVGKMVSIPGVEMNLKINPLHGVSILSTILIAILVSLVFEKEKEKNRITYELINNRLGKVILIAEDLHKTISHGEMPYKVAVSESKKIYSSIECIWEVIQEKNLNVSVTFVEIKALHHELRNLLTNIPAIVEEGQSPPLVVKKGEVAYHENRIVEIEGKLEQLKNLLFRTQLSLF